MSREIDANVAEAMGAKIAWYSNEPYVHIPEIVDRGTTVRLESPIRIPIQNYSTDIAAAWQVVEWMSARKWRILIDNDFGKWGVQLSLKGECLAIEHAPTVPEAICKAFLAAMGAGEGGVRPRRERGNR